MSRRRSEEDGPVPFEEYERDLDMTYLLHSAVGRVRGIEIAIDLVTKRAADKFIAGKDDLANDLRNLSRDLSAALAKEKEEERRVRKKFNLPGGS